MSIQFDRNGNCTGCGWSQSEVPHICGVGAVEPATQRVYLLEATAEWPDSDNYCEGSDEITTVHATLDGALAEFDRWLDRNGIDRVAAHYGRLQDAGFVGGDPDPDTFDNGVVLHWGINVTQVLA